MNLTASKSASNRTKNRVREHGPAFIEKNRVQSSKVLAGVPAILVHSQSTDWFGWLPLHEVTTSK